MVPVEEFVESLICFQIGFEEFIKLNAVRFDERRDGLDRVWAVIDLSLLECASY